VPELRITMTFEPDTLQALRLDPLQEGGYDFTGNRAQGRTDSRGRFFFPDLSPGEYHLSVNTGSFDAMVELDVRLSEGETRDDLRLVIFRGASVSGSVVDRDGAPVRLARVMAVAPGEGGRELSYTFTDGTGHFVLHGLGEGEVDLYTSELFGVMYDRQNEEGGAAPVADAVHRGIMAGSTDLRLVMPRADLIEGRVVGSDGEPVEDFLIQTKGCVEDQTIWQVRGGRFRIVVPENATIELHFYGPAIDASGSGQHGYGPERTCRAVVVPASAGQRDILVRLEPAPK
jgi:hypothetical protein